MAITSIDIYQGNTENGNLISVHNPVSFIVTATYSATAPTLLYCDIYNADSELLGRYKCIPYVDVSGTQRQFIFIADIILRGFMDQYNDFVQSANIIEYCDGFTKEFNLIFTDDTVSEELNIVVLHSARQFSQTVENTEVFNNEPLTYIGVEGEATYVYFYNDNETNVIGNNPGGSDDLVLTDYDDEGFADFDDELLTALT